MSSLLLLLVMFQTDDLVDAVNRERGGRHWIDQKPDPPKSPEEQRKTFQIEPGTRVELVAAEPLVLDPVWIDFDHRGRLFAAEYGDYPIGPVRADGSEDSDAAPLSRIVLLQDDDGDGRMDKRTVFADGLTFCHSFLPLMDGVLAAAQTQILFLKDTDGDDVADVREVWFDGFTPAHPQMQIGCPRWGMDNWIYLTYAPGNIRCLRPGFETDEPVKLPRQDMRFNPRTMEFEAISGLGQFGNTIDNNGTRFFCTNRNPIMMEIIPQWAAQKYPWVAGGRRHADVGPSGGATKVFPLVDMKSNWLSHAGTHTSACGVTAYRGDLWDSDFRNSVFVCEPVGHLVTRSIVEPQMDSPVLTARRARPKADFLASNDTWFRPASLRTGPDGALYLADMYRMWVEHPKFLPPDIAARIDWRAGEDRGRIWRIVPENHPTHPESGKSFSASELPKPYRTPQQPDDFMAQLTHNNGWRRDTARRLIVERQLDLTEHIQKAAAGQKDSHVRLSLLSALNGIAPDDVKHVIDHPPRDVRFAIALNRPELFLPEDLRYLPPDRRSPAQARFFGILHGGPRVKESAVAEMILSHGGNEWFAPLLTAVARDRAGTILEMCALKIHPPIDDGDANGDVLMQGLTPTMTEQLAFDATRTGDLQQTIAAFKALRRLHPVRPDASIQILTGMSRGVAAGGNADFRSLDQLLKNPPQGLIELARFARDVYTGCRAAIDNEARSASERVAAIKLIALNSKDEIPELVNRLTRNPQPTEVTEAIVRLVSQNPNTDLINLLIDGWNHFTPVSRRSAVAMMLTRTAPTKTLLSAMDAGRIPASVVEIDQRMRLLQHRDASIKQQAGRLFGGLVSADRKMVADEYQSAVTMESSAERGLAVFKRMCIKCHRKDGLGANVGPDISDTRNRSRDALLYDILDPNRRVDPQFTEYVVVLTDGRTLSGLLVNESSEEIVLRQPEGKERTILRAEIEELQATTRSLMPVGMEKEITVQQMADLLAYLKATGPQHGAPVDGQNEKRGGG